MKILTVSALFPPAVIGGAEISAYNLALWLRDQGHDVGVLTTAEAAQRAAWGIREDGLTFYRMHMPRAYPMFHFPTARWWQKPLWHFKDHFDPRNRKIMARVLDDFRPDFVNVHILQGLGYNALKEVARRNLPTRYVLHDMGLACIRMSMFKNGRDCDGQCVMCKGSCRYKARLVKDFARLGFSSPSRANLEKVAEFFPINRYPHDVILNSNKYPASTVTTTKPHPLTFAHIGRLHASKGVDVLLAAAEELADRYEFRMIIVGGGPQEAPLRARYGDKPWCRFTGFVPQGEVSNLLAETDVLCIPSLWLENSPGVVIHALSMGVPVIGSDKGGIPELVRDGRNGLLVEPGNVGAWRRALELALTEPVEVRRWKQYAVDHASEYAQGGIGERTLEFMQQIAR